MTYLKQFFCLYTFIICAFSQLYSQVGINTTTPRKDLEVGGDMGISDSIEIMSIKALKDTDSSTFLIQDDSFIKALDVSNPTGAALGYIQEYVIVNPNLDWVLDFNTQVNAEDYVLNTISANFNRELKMSTSDGVNSSIPYTSAFIKNGTWHIIADYPFAGTKDRTEEGTWTITTLIYSRDFSKQFGTINIPMENGSTGSAITPIIN